MRDPRNSWKILFVSASCLVSFGCLAQKPAIQAGERVEVGFTCRLPGGEVAATTRDDASLSGQAKAPVYLPRSGPETVTVTAGALPASGQARERLPFEQEVVRRLAQVVPGLPEKEVARLELSAQRYGSEGGDRIVRLAKVRKRQKEMRLSREEFAGRTGKQPEAGAPFVLDPMVPGKVAEVTDSEVVIRFFVAEGKALASPFGPVAVRELDDRYELEIGAERGALIRAGAMVGRIAAVDPETITVDFGHPFGGETLRCEVEVSRAAGAAQPDPEAERLPNEAPQRIRDAQAATPGADAGSKNQEVR